ncbi:Ankyrin repeat-containing protein [Lasiodiplodia theobromae]|uniref:Ankyrin repeat-containing protein n=1 Tax=Lasiodiplodia theobromae TaxID=45133 RepID=UPI0015C3B005|nr:Ankyrin repeat-containing protein [Lasiodiplodia theobromae]KAF4541548.1 Ankyrin repeat-containing protein [Lasiodiplodia theobromae]
MPPLLQQSEVTFTRQRVKEILEAVPYKLPIRIKQYAGTSWAPDPQRHDEPIRYTVWTTEHEYNEENTLVVYSMAERRGRAWKLCERYCETLENPSDHIERLDSLFSKVLEFNFRPPEEMDSIIDATCCLLERLPAVPPMLDIASSPSASDIDPDFFLKERPHSWENLSVVRFVDSNVIRVAMLIVMETRKRSYSWSRKIVEYINLAGELFTVASEHTSTSEAESLQLAMLRQFLWASWQRSVLLNLYFALGSEVQSANMSDRDRSMVLGVEMSAALRDALQSDSVQSSSGTKAAYMCSWAFELLRTDRAALAQDFRAFHERYNGLFGHLPPRCMPGAQGLRMKEAPKQCKGTSPASCKRFKGMKIQDQSAHALPCRGGCPRLYWDRSSYESVSGGRAVSIAHSTASRLRYCAASYSTMAVSHVWSHGQGGRPEDPLSEDGGGGTGFNSCLHRRYSSIAASRGCDSYWMDTPCIPQDHQLRSEAIREINTVFAQSRLTLVCDRDIMAIDVGEGEVDADTAALPLHLQESLLCALLVCDWNVRAWTYLESVKGREGIYLLCAGDAVVRLEAVLRSVQARGALSVAALFLTAQHLLPPWVHPNDVGKPKPRMRFRSARSEVMHVEDAAAHLSHRHASRPGDEVVIWSLLTTTNAAREGEGEGAGAGAAGEEGGGGPTDDPLRFWKRRVGTLVPTGFLISSSPRLGYASAENAGFGWAPRRPDRPEGRRRRRWSWSWWWRGQQEQEQFHFAFDGAGSEYAYITEKGLTGKWLTHLFDAHPPCYEVLRQWRRHGRSPQFRMLRSIASRMIPRKYYWGAVLAPPDIERSTSLVPVPYRGRADGTLLAVVASDGNKDGRMLRYPGRSDDASPWHWIGVVEWPKEIPLPELLRLEVLMV